MQQLGVLNLLLVQFLLKKVYLLLTVVIIVALVLRLGSNLADFLSKFLILLFFLMQILLELLLVILDLHQLAVFLCDLIFQRIDLLLVD